MGSKKLYNPLEAMISKFVPNSIFSENARSSKIRIYCNPNFQISTLKGGGKTICTFLLLSISPKTFGLSIFLRSELRKLIYFLELTQWIKNSLQLSNVNF